MERMNELGFYTLGGAPQTPRELVAEVQQAEAFVHRSTRSPRHPGAPQMPVV